MPAYIKTDTHITITFDDGETATVYSSTSNFEGVYKAIRDKDWERAHYLAFPVVEARNKVANLSGVTIDSGIVHYNGKPLHSTLTTRMIEMYNDGIDIEPMALFLVNLMANPSFRSVNELYGFLEASKLPITEDGHFLAYKVVTHDYLDCRTQTLDNSVGQTVSMARHDVNDDKNRTCAAGLHFCAREYLPAFGSGDSRLLMIKINPADVVSIPIDYNNSKGRCCKYVVVTELEKFKGEDLDYNQRSMPVENLEMPFLDTTEITKNMVTVEMVEQLNLVPVLNNEEPTIINVFEGATAAMHELDIDSSSITKVCNGKRRSAGGWGWRWAMDNPENILAK